MCRCCGREVLTLCVDAVEERSLHCVCVDAVEEVLTLCVDAVEERSPLDRVGLNCWKCRCKARHVYQPVLLVLITLLLGDIQCWFGLLEVQLLD